MSYFNSEQSIGSNKLAQSPLFKSASSGNFSTTSITYVAVTNLSVSMTTTLAGRPVELFLESVQGTQGGPGGSALGGNRLFMWIAFARVTVGFPGTTIISECFVSCNSDTALSLINLPASTYRCFDETPVGQHTFKVMAKIVTGTADVSNVRLVARQT